MTEYAYIYDVINAQWGGHIPDLPYDHSWPSPLVIADIIIYLASITSSLTNEVVIFLTYSTIILNLLRQFCYRQNITDKSQPLDISMSKI